MSNNNEGLIAWFVDNPVAANLLMLFVLIAGFMVLSDIPKELLPKTENRIIEINMAYPAASPAEVQEGIVLKMEEAIQDIEGIQHIQSISSLGRAYVRVTVEEGYDPREIKNDVSDAVERIGSFPVTAENLVVSHAKASELVMQVQLYGDFDEHSAKQLAHELKREMLTVDEIKKVAVWGDRPYEIAIEVPEYQLLKHDVSLQQIANRIRSESVSAPSGGIKAESGNVILRVEGQSYNRAEFENIVLFASDDGTMIHVKDIATVKDDFVEWGSYAYFNGQYSVGLMVSAVEGQDMLKVAEAVKQFIERKKPELPAGVQIATWADTSYYLGDRMSMMMENMWQGALLVFITLIFFVPLKTAFWVMTDLPVCVAGTFLMMYLFGVSFNMLSLFGFIMVLGMLVNDAVIIAESVDDQVRLNGMSRNSVLTGTHQVAMPAMFGVLTNIVAFLPMLFAQGPQAHWLFPIGFIFIVCMFFSLVESKFILPSHIKTTGKPWLWGPFGVQHRLQENLSAKLAYWIKHHYANFLLRCVRYRYLTVAVFISLLMLSYGAIKSGFIPYELHPAEPSDFLQVTLNMAEGTSEEQTEAVMQRIRKALDDIDQEYQAKQQTDKGLVEHVFRYSSGGVNGFFFVELSKEEQRNMNSFEILDQWRSRVGTIEGANVADFSSAGFAGGRSLSFMLVGRNDEALELASKELLDELASIKGLSNLTSSLESQRQEYVLNLKPQAQALGLTLSGVAIQVKEAFYGAEAQRIQRDNQEIVVLVRYPKDNRTSVQDLEGMPIRLANGRTVPLHEIVDIEFVMSPTRISRSNGETAVLIAAKVDYEVADPGGIRNRITNEFMPTLFEKYPSVSHQLEGYNLEQKRMEKNMLIGFLLAVLGIYVLLATPLKSYTQPIMIMSVIPFGIVGAVIGHGIMGYPLSMMSIFGIIALSGIIVNDSLLLVDFVNQSVKSGELSYEQAIIQAGQRRFRAIFLTTVTTFLGILPMTLESSIQATNMIPMAISLTFGEIFGTTITLLLIPCLYMIVIDIRRWLGMSDSSLLQTADNA